jgi:hypothetical protein
MSAHQRRGQAGQDPALVTDLIDVLGATLDPTFRAMSP